MGLPPTAWPPRCTRWCWPSSPPSRSRTCGSTSRTGTACAATTPRTRTPARPPRSLAALMREDSAPPFTGLRCKSLERHQAPGDPDAATVPRRAARARRPLPPGFVVTLPKVTSAAQVTAMAVLCERLDEAYGLGPRRAGVRDPGGDPAGDPRRRRRRDDRAVRARGRGPADRAALRHLRLQRRARHRGAASRAWSTRPPTTPGRSCRSRRRGPASG